MTIDDILRAYRLVAGRRCHAEGRATYCVTHRSKWSLGTVGCDSVVLAACKTVALIEQAQAEAVAS